MLRDKNKETNVSSSNRWQVFNTIRLCYILRLSACEPIWKIAHKKASNFYRKKEVYKFQVACVSYLNLNQNKVLKEKIGKCLYQ